MKPGVFARLLAANLLVAVGALAVLGLVVDRLLQDRALRSLKDRLVAEAASIREAIALHEGDLAEPVQRISRATGTRLTVIRTDGTVMADSDRDPATMANHRDRPEVAAALEGRIGSDQRVSETIGQPFLYVALPPRGDTIVRAALPAAIVEGERSDVRRGVAVGFTVIGVVVLVLTALIARAISRPILRLAAEVPRVADGSAGRVDVRGPLEIERLANAVNAMATELAQRMDEVKAEAALREQILGAMNEAVVLTDTSRVVFANPAAEDLLGARTGSPPPGELDLAPDEGGRIAFEIHHPVHRLVQATVVALDEHRTLAVAQDVTMAARVERMRRDFVADASHELKTPVAAMRAAAESIQIAVEDDPDSAKRFADQLVRQCERLSVLVQDLLDLARLEQEVAELAPVDLGAVVREEVGTVRPRLDGAGLTLSMDVSSGALIVHGREADLHLVVRNLLDNAVRYSSAGGTIRVAAEPDDTRARITITDSGRGIPSKDLPRIFERFYRVDPSRARDTGGSGLGLAIVKHVVEQHAGTVEVQSELGVGSTFTVLLPLDPGR